MPPEVQIKISFQKLIEMNPSAESTDTMKRTYLT